MRRIAARQMWFSIVLVVAGTIAHAADGQRPTPVNDPALLVSLGLSPSARNVFAYLERQEMAIGQTVDTKSCSYRLQVFLTQNSTQHILNKVRAQWVRQVSPAPATARFLDVPTNHPFFKFVEALAASGITGGCSANQYCPDSPVTRGQMAVFLATALGLNWGGL